MSDVNRRRELERIAALVADEGSRGERCGPELAWLYQQHQRLERKFAKVARISDLMQARLKENQESLLLAMQVAEANDIAKDRFIADVSHEIRTPLSSVLCILGMLEQQEDDPDKKGLLQLALDAGDALLRLSNDILDLARMDAGKLELIEEEFRLDQLLGRLVQLHAVTAAGRGLTIRFESAPDVPVRLRGDALKLEQVLRNLLDNAVKFTPAGDIVVRVSAAGGAAAGLLTFRVEDSGIGIPAAELPYIFESYRQVRSPASRRSGGSGLGLAIVKSLVELMGGTIAVTSEPGQGSVFTLTLPFAVAGQDSIRTESAEDCKQTGDAVPRPGEPAVAAPLLDIVLADDHRLFRETMEAMLTSQDNLRIVAEAGSGAEVLAAAREHRPTIILLDLRLGTDNGLELLAAIREISPATRVVVLTADDSTDSLRLGIERGVDGYLLKTLPARELVHSLRAVAAGAMVLPATLRRRSESPSPAMERPLSPRETEILHLIAGGKSNPEIAIITGISENTVKSHVRALMEKLEAHNRVLLLAAAARRGLLPPSASTPA